MTRILSSLLALGLTLGSSAVGSVSAVEPPCREAYSILGLSVQPAKQSESVTALVITEVVPLSQGARIGLRKDDVIEQANSWQTADCEGYRNAVREAREQEKALLLLVKRGGRQQTFVLEAGIWRRQEKEQQAREAVGSLQTMLAAPLPPALAGSVERTGAQALKTLRQVEVIAELHGRPDAYTQEVRNAKAQLVGLDNASQGEADKRVAAAARTVLDYYVTAQEIFQYRKDFVAQLRDREHKGRDVALSQSDVPYYFDSPVPGWISRYPFLRASVTATPETVGLLKWQGEWAGKWNPDKAMQLLWDKAKQETDLFAQWLKTGTGDRGQVTGNR